MPARDGSGPEGKGSRTGRGAGDCEDSAKPGFIGLGRRRRAGVGGFGRGRLGRGMWGIGRRGKSEETTE